MRPLLLAVLLFLAAFPLFAITADLAVDVHAYPPNVRPGANTDFWYDVTNLGPDTVPSYVVTIAIDGVAAADTQCGNGCTFNRFLTKGQLDQHYVNYTAPQSGSATIHVSVTSDATDPNPSNNSDSIAVPVSTNPDSTISLSPTKGQQYNVLLPGEAFTLNVTLYNRFATAHDLVATIDAPAEATIVEMPSACSASAGHITCAMGDVGPDFNAQLPLKLLTPSRPDGGRFTVTASVTQREPDFNEEYNHATVDVFVYRMFFVTTTADSGPGSLRQAFLDVDQACGANGVPCRIAFEIRDESPALWKSIHLQSPLRAVLAPFVVIDGQWQTSHVGDTNPDGPEIEITGDGVVPDGLTIGLACYSEVDGLAINGFFGNGMTIINTGPGCGTFPIAQLHDLYIGTDPTGTVAKPNALRGITANFTNLGPQQGAVYASTASIHDNVLSGNARSGLFVASGGVYVTNNRIGLKAHSDDPLPNGASGIYTGSGGWFENNVIAFNDDFGIAIDGHVKDFDHMIYRNRSWANRNAALDVGLDNQPTASCAGMPPPAITAARYDAAAGQTIVEGDIKFVGHQTYNWGNVTIFGSDTSGTRGLGDAQRIIGEVTVGKEMTSEPVPPHFTATIAGDHRGEWVTATLTRYEYLYFAKPAATADQAQYHCTTELSLPMQVSP